MSTKSLYDFTILHEEDGYPFIKLTDKNDTPIHYFDRVRVSFSSIPHVIAGFGYIDPSAMWAIVNETGCRVSDIYRDRCYLIPSHRLEVLASSRLTRGT